MTRAESNKIRQDCRHYPIHTLVGNDADARKKPTPKKQDWLAGLYSPPTWVGNGTDARREQRKQIALQGFTQCPPR